MLPDTAALWFGLGASCLGFHVLAQALRVLAWQRERRLSGRATPCAEPVTVVLTCRNEAHNLPACLQALGQQDYPDLAFVLVDDGSTDQTLDLLQAFARNRPACQVVQLPVQRTADALSRKKALIRGCELARTEALLLTDADCQMGNRWVSTMMSRWSASTDFILGIGLYHRQPGLLNLMIQAETQYTAWLYGSAAMLGFPYMAVGRNLAVRRAVLLGFARGDVFWQTPSGSDDLVVNHLGTRHNTRVCIHPEAYTHSNPKQTWHDWLTQKSRHTQGSTGYSLASRAALLVWEATHLGGVLWLGLQSVSLLIGWLVLKNLGFLPFYHSFNILWGILVEICHLIYLIFVCIVLPFYPRTWKLNSPVHPELKRTAP